MKFFIVFFILFFCFFQTQSQNKNVYATVKDQHGNTWNNLEVKLYINQNENSFKTAQLQDSLVIVNGIVEFQNIVITQLYEMQEETDLVVFPNPCSGVFKINFGEKSSTKVVNLFNTNAQKVKSFRVNNYLAEQEFDISEFADGIYFCEIISEKKQSCIKLIKNQFSSNQFSSRFKLPTKSSETTTVHAWLQLSGDEVIQTTFAFELEGTQNLGDIIIQRKERVFTDERDGRKYQYTNIGSQSWMAENLAWLPRVVGTDSSSLSTPYYYVYGYNDTLVSAAKLTNEFENSGVLYNLPAALNACPAGWRLPTKNDWDSMATFIQNENNCPDVIEDFGWYKYPEVGEYLKSDSGWITQNGNNKYKFNGLPGGYYNYDFSSSNDGMYWSSTEGLNPDYVWAPDLGPDGPNLDFWSTEKKQGRSVRCIAENTIADTLEVLHSTIGPAGGKIILNNFVIAVPQGAFTENIPLTAKLINGDPFGENKQKSILQIQGLPLDFGLPLSIKIAKFSEADSAILLLEDVFTHSLNSISETVVPLETQNTNDTLIAEIPVIDNTKSGSFTKETLKNVTVRLVVTEYGKYKVKSEHFTIHNLMYKGVDRNHHLDSLAGYLEKAYDILSKAPYQFSFSKRSWPMDVYVKSLEKDVDGKFQESMFGRDYSSLSFNGWTLYKEQELKASAMHEFFHLVQSFYDTRSSFLRSKSASTSYWFDEAVSVWSEHLMSKSADFISGARNGKEIMPITGLHTPLEEKEDYGYGMSAFVKYLIDRYGFSYIKKIYETIEMGSIYPVSAIEIEIPDEIPAIYANFIEDYVLGKIYKDLTVQLLRSYKSQNITLNNSSTKTISINETFKNLSSKIYTFNIDKTTLNTANSIKITSQNQNVQLLMIKYKKNTTTGEWERTKASEGKSSVELKNIKQIFDDGYDLLLIAT